jgi:hypothetical protein
MEFAVMSDDHSGVSGTPLKPALPFSEALLSRVQGYVCGTEPFEQEVAAWIQAARGAGGALDELENAGTLVWLYESEAGELVGIGSLGVTQWRWDNPKKGPWTPIWIIPFYGVQTPFQGQPPGARENRYARRIFEDLLAKAMEQPPQHPSWAYAFILPMNEPFASTAPTASRTMGKQSKVICE